MSEPSTEPGTANCEGRHFYIQRYLQLQGAATCLRRQAVQAGTVYKEYYLWFLRAPCYALPLLCAIQTSQVKVSWLVCYLEIGISITSLLALISYTTLIPSSIASERMLNLKVLSLYSLPFSLYFLSSLCSVLA